VIRALARHLTVYVSSNDRALLMSHWVNHGRRLGRTAEIAGPPETRTEQYQFQEAQELLDLQAKGLGNLAVVDGEPSPPCGAHRAGSALLDRVERLTKLQRGPTGLLGRANGAATRPTPPDCGLGA